ncbi:hypothetical protein AG0111_0g1813 [Alternaria gaisen]|uniref:Uncharacterized protein n=1 Tax=Alternaria gaisen TaxID=167740 RepID=A0ACB6G382_9PLEO|nr:hypothetical protein AG0111_0g1813 [Alternaria gaisen]
MPACYVSSGLLNIRYRKHSTCTTEDVNERGDQCHAGQTCKP